MRGKLLLLFLLAVQSVLAGEQGGQAWLDQADSLRNEGQDAAALDFLGSAEAQFRRSGQTCWAARFAERRARIHLDWDNPSHAAEALAAALLSANNCSELEREIHGWRFALAQTKMDLGEREEARWLLTDIVDEGASREENIEFRMLAVESLGRLAHLSLEEGSYTVAEEDFNRWARELESMGDTLGALDSWGWSAVSSALDGRHAETWSALRHNPFWDGIPVHDRAIKGVAWAQILLTAGITASFDSLATWPWAKQLERSPGSVDALIETRWAMLRARRYRKEHAAQALAASHQAELAARSIRDPVSRRDNLSSALRLRADILAGTGAVGPAYHALHEADSLSIAAGRAERARTGLFESEPWLAAIGDERTRLETVRMQMWRKTAGGLAVLLILACIWVWRTSRRAIRLRKRMRHLQHHWLPGRQHQVREFAVSGARLAESAQGHPLPAELKRELAEFGRLATLCSAEVDYTPIDLKQLCLTLADELKAEGGVDWSLQEEIPFRGDAVQLRDFLKVLLAGMGQGGCRMAMRSTTQGLEVDFDNFAERAWWREAVSLFAGDGVEHQWSMVRLRCDRLGGIMQLDCDASGAQRLKVDLPVYSA